MSVRPQIDCAPGILLLLLGHDHCPAANSFRPPPPKKYIFGDIPRRKILGIAELWCHSGILLVTALFLPASVASAVRPKPSRLLHGGPALRRGEFLSRKLTAADCSNFPTSNQPLSSFEIPRVWQSVVQFRLRGRGPWPFPFLPAAIRS